MDVRQLRYLVALADERHFTRAARTLGIAQPALSQQINRLEAQVGMPLVERTTRSVRMTEAGETLVAAARRILREVDVAQDELRALAGLQTGRVVVGVTRTPGAVDVAALLGRFHRAHPGIDLDVREDLSVGLLRMLEADELDLALIAEGRQPPPPSIEVRRLASEDLVAMVPPDHALAGRPSLSFDALRAEPLVAFHRGATIREQLEARAAEAGGALHVAFETADAHRLRALVGHGLGLGVLPASEARAPGPRVAVVPFAGTPLAHRTAVATRAGRRRAPAVRAFLEGLGDPARRAPA